MTTQTLTHFCRNPKCHLHGVQVTGATTKISRLIPNGPVGEMESHERFTYGGGVALCEVCHEAVQTLADTFSQEVMEGVKKDSANAAFMRHPTVAGFNVIDASDEGLWTPPEKKVITH